MLILCRVAVEFKDPHGNILFTVEDKDRNTFLDAPDTITQDPYFHLMLSDGTIEAGVERAKMRKIEQDPTAGHDAAGKLILPESSASESTPTRSRARKTASTPETGDAP